MLVCDSCDKCYHMYCLKPEQMGSMDTNGWKCTKCRTELLTKFCLSCNICFVQLKDSKPQPFDSFCEECEESRIFNLSCIACFQPVLLSDPKKRAKQCVNCSK